MVQELIDAHSHVWTPDEESYPVLPEWKGAVQPDSFTVDQLLEQCRRAGVSRVNLIQMIHYGQDNSYITDAIAAHPDMFVGTAVVHFAESDVAERMAALKSKGITSFRIYPGLERWSGPAEEFVAPAQGWLDRPGYRTMFATAARTGKAMACLVDPNGLPEIDRMCREFPNTRVIIDHVARIRVKDGEASGAELDALCALAVHRNIYVKLGAFYSKGSDPTYEDLVPMLRRVIEAFGANRCMWESDAPFQITGQIGGGSGLGGDGYKVSADFARRGFGFLSDEDTEWVCWRTAKELLFDI
ncbi:amidohydrolase 2 [Hyaloraphidium curvatum]|nr:amidohydrolase 2 [Hyaloraphidium curvatum]